MMRPLRIAAETSIGETNLANVSKPLLGKAYYYVVTHLITTWPGGKAKAPDFWTPPAEQGFGEEKAALLAALERYAEKYNENPEYRAIQPMMGPLSLRQWSPRFVIKGQNFAKIVTRNIILRDRYPWH